MASLTLQVYQCGFRSINLTSCQSGECPNLLSTLFIYSFIYLFIYLFIHLFIHFLAYLFLAISFVYSFIYLVNFLYIFIYLFIYLFYNIQAICKLTFFFLFQIDQEFKNVRQSVNESNGILSKLMSSLQGLKLKVHRFLEITTDLNQMVHD